MTTITFVRHGETVWHAENRYAGSTDVGLTELGLRQAAQLGEWARAARLDAVVTSDLDRSIRTAAPAVESTGLAPIVEPRLREVDFGAGEGHTKSEMRERFPEAVQRFHRWPAESPLPDGERGNAAVERAGAAVRQLLAGFPDGRILVVGHATLHRLLLCRLLDIDPNRYRTLFPQLRNVARSTLRFTADAEDPSHTGDAFDSVALLEFNVPLE